MKKIIEKVCKSTVAVVLTACVGSFALPSSAFAYYTDLDRVGLLEIELQPEDPDFGDITGTVTGNEDPENPGDKTPGDTPLGDTGTDAPTKPSKPTEVINDNETPQADTPVKVETPKDPELPVTGDVTDISATKLSQTSDSMGSLVAALCGLMVVAGLSMLAAMVRVKRLAKAK